MGGRANGASAPPAPVRAEGRNGAPIPGAAAERPVPAGGGTGGTSAERRRPGISPDAGERLLPFSRPAGFSDGWKEELFLREAACLFRKINQLSTNKQTVPVRCIIVLCSVKLSREAAADLTPSFFRHDRSCSRSPAHLLCRRTLLASSLDAEIKNCWHRRRAKQGFGIGNGSPTTARRRECWKEDPRRGFNFTLRHVSSTT